MKKITILLAFIALTFTACQSEKYPELEDGVYAEFVTNHGTFVAKLHHDKTPITVSSFVDLAEGKNHLVDSAYKNKPFFNGLTFHRIIKNFVIQGGDPDGTGMGGPGYRFPDEFDPELSHHKKGILSMANAGPGTNGSQFFVTLKETPHLNGRHTVFGEVVLGMEIVDKIGALPTKPDDSPESKVVMNEVNIIKKGNVKLNTFEKEMEAIESERKAKMERVANVKEATLAEFKEYEAKAEELPSGLRIYYNKKGDGPKPKEGDVVFINYEGYLEDGTLFDTSVLEIAEKYEAADEQKINMGRYNPMPTQFSVDAGLIPGFREGMLKMQTGDVVTLFIPSHLTYGEQGAGGDLIPPNSNLIFRVEMVNPEEVQN